MKQLIYILVFLTLSSCSTKTSLNEKTENEFTNEFISDSLLTEIPTIGYSKFELTNTDNKNVKNKYIGVNQKQLNFFYTHKELKELTDYFDVMHVYFYGKRKLGTEKMALFILIDADYQGIYLYCAIVDKEGRLIGKFLPAYIDYDGDYSDVVKGEFLNDSTYKYSEVSFAYIDVDHKNATQDSTIKIVKITNKKIQTKIVEKFPTDTLLENVSNNRIENEITNR